MSRGISARQRLLLRSIARQTVRQRPVQVNEAIAWRWFEQPVAWRLLDSAASATGSRGNDCSIPTGSRGSRWNREQSTRRALRSLARRGLIELGRYVFDVTDDYQYLDPADHTPGDTRIMAGALLTATGWAIAYPEGDRPELPRLTAQPAMRHP